MRPEPLPSRHCLKSREVLPGNYFRINPGRARPIGTERGHRDRCPQRCRAATGADHARLGPHGRSRSSCAAAVRVDCLWRPGGVSRPGHRLRRFGSSRHRSRTSPCAPSAAVVPRSPPSGPAVTRTKKTGRHTFVTAFGPLIHRSTDSVVHRRPWRLGTILASGNIGH